MHAIVLYALIAYQFDVPVPQGLVDAMRKETATILRQSGIELQWWDRGSSAEMPTSPEIFVMRFRGDCSLVPAVKGPRDIGPLAVTHMSDGEVLPFSDVDCDTVRRSLRTTASPRTARYDNALFGRALGRIAAHEIVHMATRSTHHGHRGVAQPAFTSEELLADEFLLAPEDVYRLRDSFR